MNISVVIPAYNEEEHISECLQSLVDQEVPPTEIIVVNNNSTDKTAEVVKRFPVRLISETKQGITPTRNAGLNAAKYEIIARCDADTILPPDWIKKIKEHFADSSIDALAGTVIYYDLPVMNGNTFFTDFFLNLMKLSLGGKDTLLGMNMILRKSVWEKVKDQVCLNDKMVHEDIDLSIHLLKNGCVIKKDHSLVVKASGRRIKDRPTSFFIEYPYRLLKTFAVHWR